MRKTTHPVLTFAPAALAALTALTATTPATALTSESGSFVGLMSDQRDLAFPSGSGLYVPPTANDLADMRLLAEALAAEDIPLLQARALAVDYEVVEFTDDFTGNTYLGVRENLVNGEFTRGWGTYWVDQTHGVDAIVSAPHPLFDVNSTLIAANAFRRGDARFYMQAGAHRNANGFNTADVADDTPTVFNEINRVFHDTSVSRHWQVHGFTFNDQPGWPTTTDAILSNGTGNITEEIVILDAELEDEGFETYVYNQLGVGNAINQAVNDGLDGADFFQLSALGNGQKNYAFSVGDVFVHIELEWNIRNNATDRIAASQAIADAMTTANQVPTPGSALVLCATAPALFRRRR